MHVCVSGFLHVVPHGLGFSIEYAEELPVPIVVTTRHELDTCIRTQGLRIGVVEAYSLFGQAIKSGRAVTCTAVATEALPRRCRRP